MADMYLTQAEADSLIALEKHRINNDRHNFPMSGGSLIVPLHSPDKREYFLLDIGRGRIDLLKGKIQNRARQVVVLLRLDIGGAPHRNPDGTEVGCPHLHIYREGYGNKWAMPAPSDKFKNTSDLWGSFQDFLIYCNITRPPYIERGLFT
jgi:hypothetical protein